MTSQLKHYILAVCLSVRLASSFVWRVAIGIEDGLLGFDPRRVADCI
jgi:hypothetical protein